MKNITFMAILFLITVGLCACQKQNIPTGDETIQSETEGSGTAPSEPVSLKYPYANDRMVYFPLENGKIEQWSPDGTYQKTISLPADDYGANLADTELLWVGNDELIWCIYGDDYDQTVLSTPIRSSETGEELADEQTKELFALDKTLGISTRTAEDACTIYADEDRLIFSAYDYITDSFYMYDRKTGGAPAKIEPVKDAYTVTPNFALSLSSTLIGDRLIYHTGQAEKDGEVTENKYGFWSYDLIDGHAQEIDARCFSGAAYVTDPARNAVYYQVIDDQSIWQYDCGSGETKELIPEAQFQECYEENGLTWDDAYYNDALFIEGDRLYFAKNVRQPLIFSYSLSDRSLAYETALTETVQRTGYNDESRDISYRLAIVQGKLLLYWDNWDEDEEFYICIDIPTATAKAVGKEDPEKVYFQMIGAWENPGTVDEWEPIEPEQPDTDETSSAPLSIENQLACISRCKEMWLDDEYYESDPYIQYYAITDLDHNGRLEVIASSGGQGSAFVTTTYYYQVSADGTTLRRITDGIEGIDIVDGIDTAYVDKETGTYYYCVHNYISGGAGARYGWYGSMVLKNGMLTDHTYATIEATWNSKKKKEKWRAFHYVNGKKKKVPAEKFDSETYAAQFFAGYEKKSVNLSWFTIRGKKKLTETDIRKKVTKSYQAFRPSSSSSQ